MKFISFSLVAACFSFALPIMGANLQKARGTALCGDIGAATTFYRTFYPSPGGDHFYFTGAFLLPWALLHNVYLREPDAGLIFGPQNQQPGTVPFFALYNEKVIDHFYTTDPTARANAISAGYDDQGVVGYVYLDQSCPQTIPLYWSYSAVYTDNLYTPSQAEYNASIASGTYVGKGIAAYIYPTSS